MRIRQANEKLKMGEKPKSDILVMVERLDKLERRVDKLAKSIGINHLRTNVEDINK